jgi:DNA-binding MarR family transcriptional regulator
MPMTKRKTEKPSAIQRELRQTRPFPSAGQEAAVTLLRTADVIRQDLERTLEPFGITPQQYNVLRILRGSHPETLPTLEIAERMVERAPGITRLLDRLEAAGQVSRARCPEDRRRVLVSITRKGLATLADTDATVNGIEGARLAKLGATELARLVESLDRIREESP